MFLLTVTNVTENHLVITISICDLTPDAFQEQQTSKFCPFSPGRAPEIDGSMLKLAPRNCSQYDSLKRHVKSLTFSRPAFSVVRHGEGRGAQRPGCQRSRLTSTLHESFIITIESISDAKFEADSSSNF